MEFVDSTALATALPRMASSFAVRPESLKLALTVYVLALALFTPASGWLADRFGAKRVYLGAMGAFCCGSLACALSSSIAALVASRVLQGLGGALMAPVGRTIIVRSAPRSQLVSAMNWFTMPAQLGPLLGPPIAGLVLAVADWRWIFLINLPVAALGAVAIGRFVSNETLEETRKLDLPGYVIAATAFSLLVGATELAGSYTHWGTVVAVLAAAVVTAIWYVRHALRTPHPILDVRLFVYPTFRISMAAGTVARLAAGATPLLMPLLLQIGLGWTPLQSGLVQSGQAVGTLLAKVVSTRALRRYGFRTVLIAASLTAAGATTLPSLYRHSTPAWLIFGLLVGTALARSLQFTANNTIAYAELSQPQLADAATLASVTQQVGLAIGVSSGGLLLFLSRQAGGGTLTEHSFALPFIVIGILTTGAALLYARLHPNAGAGLRGI